MTEIINFQSAYSGEGHSDTETHLCSLSIDPIRVIKMYSMCPFSKDGCL